ncbi:MAG: BREX system P-loop protein BrxC [Saccharospirillaceae bacterium]|nr:BREX system P-loop protein BrxC [Pseudomonadales bacterium]NRB78692.1 BREX system P-loop protein BrxC [Saccharospirillaceae bacterium]
MTTINEILTLDLQEDIKNVIDLEDHSENEIQQEIESYIVTEGIGRHLDSFTNKYTSNMKETGVWLSGFYGSGKSYFGKMLGYIIDNPNINGTPARERFIAQLKGIENEGLIENALRNLDSINSRVIFLDVAKQNTDKGLSFTLFTNLLKNLGFREDVYGYMEFELFIDGKYEEFKLKAKEIENKEWSELKKSNRQVARVMRKVFLAMGYREVDYSEMKDVYTQAIKTFSVIKFKDELERYLKFKKDETLVFIFDEASEAITQNKFSLLDLEGISEALSSISKKVWTIAIAQEKLDSVINNANVSRSSLTKVTDRFKTKIHLESTEVDVIIRSRLLQKKETYYNQLVEYYNNNEGLIADATNLKSSFPTKTESAEEFATYYPFHKYQFDILQKFLFSSNALVATQIAARGMIITTFDVLRKQMRDQSLFSFTTGHALCSEAQTAPPVDLVNKYHSAKKILDHSDFGIEGDKLLKTIHILADSEVVSPTIENITKSYITEVNDYYAIKPKIEESLKMLLGAKVLLSSNNNYKITSDLEGKLLEEMNEFNVELFNKKRDLINFIKNYKIFQPIASFNDGHTNFKFKVLSDQDDELCGTSGNKNLKLTAYGLFNISDDRQEFIENIKLETQYNKDLITLIPSNKDFNAIDKLIVEVHRYQLMEDKYATESDVDKRRIIAEFKTIKEEKEKELQVLIEYAYKHSTLVYLFDDYLLNEDTFKGTITENQRKTVKNIYFKQLKTQLSESLVTKIFNNRKEDLHKLFSGDDFKFFDSNGNFIGEHLKVVEEITVKIKSRHVDGRSMEADFSNDPWGYSYGTLVTTLAVLLRAGKLAVKYNGDPYLSHDQKAVHEAFTNTTKFKSASFKSISASLTSAQKKQAVQLLMEIDIEKHTNKKVDWSTNDYELAESTKYMADHFITAISTLNSSVNSFETLFSNVAQQKDSLLDFSSKVTENNYIDKIEYLLINADIYKAAIQTILKAQKFIKKNYAKVNDFKAFAESVKSELVKANITDDAINTTSEELLSLYKQDMVKNFAAIQQQAQKIKDSYYRLVKSAAQELTTQCDALLIKVNEANSLLTTNYPKELNTNNINQLNTIKKYCLDRVLTELELGFSISCKNSGFSLSELLTSTELVPSKENDLLILENSFVSEPPPQPEPIPVPEPQPSGGQPAPTPMPAKPVQPEAPRKLKLSIPSANMTVQEYKNILTAQLRALASAHPDDKIELDLSSINTKSSKETA